MAKNGLHSRDDMVEKGGHQNPQDCGQTGSKLPFLNEKKPVIRLAANISDFFFIILMPFRVNFWIWVTALFELSVLLLQFYAISVRWPWVARRRTNAKIRFLKIPIIHQIIRQLLNPAISFWRVGISWPSVKMADSRGVAHCSH